MDDSNGEESNAHINISETSAVDEDVGSNNRGGKETNNNTWSEDDHVIKIFPFSENAGLKLDVPENDNPSFYFKLLVSDELLGGIVQRSNKYACRVIDSNCPLHHKSILNKWKEVLTESGIKKNSISPINIQLENYSIEHTTTEIAAGGALHQQKPILSSKK